MNSFTIRTSLLGLVAISLVACDSSSNPPASNANFDAEAPKKAQLFSIDLKPVEQFAFANTPTKNASEIVAFDKKTKRTFVVNSSQKSVDVLTVGNDLKVTKAGSIDLSTKGKGLNSVAAHDGLLAVAVEKVDGTDSSKQELGVVALYDASTLAAKDTVDVGFLPDMVTFTPDGKYILVANEGEPNDAYTADPVGSISMIKVDGLAVINLGFNAFNTGGSRASELPSAVRMPRPKNATVAQDLEPEYITVSADSKKAWVVLQENNALVEIDIEKQKISKFIALGTKDYSIAGNEMDPTDKKKNANGNKELNPAVQPNVVGMYMPDGIASYQVDGVNYVLTANEGDGREYFFATADAAACTAAGGLEFDKDDGCLSYTDESRMKDVTNLTADFQAKTGKEDLGRLKVSIEDGRDASGVMTKLHSYGARSFSIWNVDTGTRVFDSGSQFVNEVKKFYASDTNKIESIDKRSDDKGVEPESVVVGTIDGRHFAFIGLERAGGIMVYDVTDPANAKFIEYQPGFSADASKNILEDVSPEGLVFIAAADNPSGKDLLLASHEISGTTTVFTITKQ